MKHVFSVLAFTCLLFSNNFVYAQTTINTKEFDDGDEEMREMMAQEEAAKPVIVVLSSDPKYTVVTEKDGWIYTPIATFVTWKMVNQDEMVNIIKNGGRKRGHFTQDDLLVAFSEAVHDGDLFDVTTLLDAMEKNNIDLNKGGSNKDNFHSTSCNLIRKINGDVIFKDLKLKVDANGAIRKPRTSNGLAALDYALTKFKKEINDLKCQDRPLLAYMDAEIKAYEMDGLEPDENKQVFLERVAKMKKARNEFSAKYYEKAKPKLVAISSDPNMQIAQSTHDAGDIRVEIQGNQLSTKCQAHVVTNLMEDAIKRFRKGKASEGLEVFNLNDKNSDTQISHCIGQMRIYRITTPRNEDTTTPPANENKKMPANTGTKK